MVVAATTAAAYLAAAAGAPTIRPGGGGGEELPQIEVAVLRDGFHGWVNKWRRPGGGVAVDEERVLDFDPRCWQDCSECSDRLDMPQMATLSGKSLGLVHSMDAVWSKGGQQELASALEDVLNLLSQEESEEEEEEDGRAAARSGAFHGSGGVGGRSSLVLESPGRRSSSRGGTSLGGRSSLVLESPTGRRDSSLLSSLAWEVEVGKRGSLLALAREVEAFQQQRREVPAAVRRDSGFHGGSNGFHGGGSNGFHGGSNSAGFHEIMEAFEQQRRASLAAVALPVGAAERRRSCGRVSLVQEELELELGAEDLDDAQEWV